MTSAPQTLRLSVAIIVRDAAEPLRLTLASIRDVANEIVVVDTGSVDKTIEVASEFNSRVSSAEWCDDFSAARNFAASLVTGDWILWLDAGETLSESDAMSLRHFISTEAKSDRAYLLLVRVKARDAAGADEQIGQVRLVPNLPGITFSGKVRETILPSLRSSGIQIKAAPFLIRRDEREHDPRVKKQRAQRNLRIAEKELRANEPAGNAAKMWNCLGESLQTLENYARAVECFQQTLRIAERGSIDMLEAYYGLLTSLDGTGDRALQLSTCIQAIEIFPLDAQLLCALGGYLHVQGKEEFAEKAYLTCYRYGQIQPTLWHVVEIRDIGGSCHSISLQLQNKIDEATQFLEDAVRERPESERLRRRLIEAYVNAGQRDAALAHVNALPKTTPKMESLRSAVRGACYASQKNWLAAKAYLRAAFNHGCRDPLCLKWLAISLLGCGELSGALPILEEWKQAEPRNQEPSRLLAAIAASAKNAANERQHRVDSGAPATPRTSLPISISPSRAAPFEVR